MSGLAALDIHLCRPYAANKTAAGYDAVDEQTALNALDALGERWDKNYPKISQSWRANWANLSPYFKISSGGAQTDLYHQCHGGL